MAVERLGALRRFPARSAVGIVVDRMLGRSSGAVADPLAALRSARSYARQIDRLHERHLLGGGMHDLREGDVSLASVVTHRDEVARLLARAVAAGEYHFRPATVRTIRAGGKLRDVYALSLADMLVAAAVADALDAAIAPTLAPSLYSYRAGVPWWRGAQALASYVRAHKRAHPDPRDRGLYVLRRDVERYTDTIPVGPGSAIWPQLRAVLGDVRKADWELIESTLRPAIAGRRNGPEARTAGVPTGQPISCVAFNLYLSRLDHDLAAIPGAFFARYSDDLVFAHPDPGVVVGAASIVDQRIAELGIRLNPDKSRDLYLTGAGRPSSALAAFRGTTTVGFLGLQVSASGTLALEPAKARALTRDLARRANGAARAAATPREAARRACAAVRRALQSNDPSISSASASLVQSVVTDRDQLRDLDRRIAQSVASAVTGEPSVRAFRSLSTRTLRTRHGLPSLVALRNASGRRRVRR